MSLTAIARRLNLSIERRLNDFRNRSIRQSISRQIRQIDDLGLALVSSNCVAGILYDWAGLQKRSPTAGIYFTNLAFAQFLEDLNAGELERWSNLTVEQLRYRQVQSCWELPVEDAGQLVFLHYQSAADAAQKWNRRTERLRGRIPLVITSIQGGIPIDSLKKLLGKLRYSFTVDGDPAPDADRLMMVSGFLHDLSTYLQSIIDGAGSRAELRRY